MIFIIPKFLVRGCNTKYKEFWHFERGKIVIHENAPETLKKADLSEVYRLDMTPDTLEAYYDNMGGGLPRYILDRMKEQIDEYGETANNETIGNNNSRT